MRRERERLEVGLLKRTNKKNEKQRRNNGRRKNAQGRQAERGGEARKEVGIKRAE